MSGRVTTVDHSAPIHDGLCRCRACKPSLVGSSSQALLRVRVALATGGMLAVVLIAIQMGRGL